MHGQVKTGSLLVTALQARPNPIDVDFRRTALIVVDMQNAFASRGGMFDLAGFDISGASRVIAVNRALLGAARQAGVRVIYLQMTFKRDLSDAGDPGRRCDESFWSGFQPASDALELRACVRLGDYCGTNWRSAADGDPEGCTHLNIEPFARYLHGAWPVVQHGRPACGTSCPHLGRR